MDLAEFAGVDYVDVQLGGATYRAGELTLREWAPVAAWIKATVPGPLSSLGSPDFMRLPPSLKRDVLAEALEQDRSQWPPSPGSKGWLIALDHDGGHAVALLALLRKHRPGITLEECEALAAKATLMEFMSAVLAGLGYIGPKSPTPEPGKNKRKAPGASSRTTSASSRTRSRKPGDGRKTTSST